MTFAILYALKSPDADPAPGDFANRDAALRALEADRLGGVNYSMCSSPRALVIKNF